MKGAPVVTDAAEGSHAAQKPAPGKLFVQAQDAFLEPHGVRIGHHEGHIGHDGTNVADMIVNALQLEAGGAQGAGPGRRLHARGALDGMTESGRMRKA